MHRRHAGVSSGGFAPTRGLQRNRDRPLSQDIVISIDAMGGDHGPAIVIPAVDIAARANPDLRFLLHGDEARINV